MSESTSVLILYLKFQVKVESKCERGEAGRKMKAAFKINIGEKNGSI